MITIQTDSNTDGSIRRATVWLEEGGMLMYLVATGPDEKSALIAAKQNLDKYSAEVRDAVKRLSKGQHGGRR